MLGRRLLGLRFCLGGGGKMWMVVVVVLAGGGGGASHNSKWSTFLKTLGMVGGGGSSSGGNVKPSGSGGATGAGLGTAAVVESLDKFTAEVVKKHIGFLVTRACSELRVGAFVVDANSVKIDSGGGGGDSRGRRRRRRRRG
ncbi:hypothetical protein BDR26DRAFT_29458 [Obelidium mucronatum]|nr:hypothetical protein BDR26DRAFT_29458 [Obelidium mucronatum]